MILVYKIERRSAGEGRPDYFVRRTARRPYLEVIHEPVPDFEGPEAYFEVEKLPRRALRFIQKVEG